MFLCAMDGGLIIYTKMYLIALGFKRSLRWSFLIDATYKLQMDDEEYTNHIASGLLFVIRGGESCIPITCLLLIFISPSIGDIILICVLCSGIVVLWIRNDVDCNLC